MKLRFPVQYDRQLQQWLDSHVRVTGHEPSSAEIAAFEARQYRYSTPAQADAQQDAS